MITDISTNGTFVNGEALADKRFRENKSELVFIDLSQGIALHPEMENVVKVSNFEILVGYW